MSNSDMGAGIHKLCSNYPNTWPGDLLWEDAAIFHLSHMWIIFSLYFAQDTFSVNTC